MPTANQTADSLQAIAYLNENVGAFTVPGPHHRDIGSQDTFWPALDGRRSPIAAVSHLDAIQHGRLYLLADGVSLCADGQEAARLAVETAGQYFYQTVGAYPDTEHGRQQRLEDAIWQAHLALSNWDEKYFCWRSERHDDGVQHHFKKGQLTSIKPPLCPLCNEPLVGLQTTLLGMLLRGSRLSLVGIGDSSAFRLPARSEFGVEWIHTPHEDQFLGMPSLTRQAVVSRTVLVSARDQILLCSDGAMRVLNALDTGQPWHGYLRERLKRVTLGTVVPNLVRDLDSWRQTRPRQRKLQDDLTIVSLAIADEAACRDMLREAVLEYDALAARQRLVGVLAAADYEEFLESAENALLHTDHPQLWQLYSNGLHGYALAKLNESVSFNDSAIHELLHNAARLTRRTREWVIAYTQLGRLSAWVQGEESPAAHASDAHYKLISDLYGVDLRDATPNAVPRIVDILNAVAKQLDQAGQYDDANQYRNFAGYLGARQPRFAPSSLLPARDADSRPPEADNAEALELQIAQAISDQDWRRAQDLIIELNKIKGDDTLTLDTESVDTMVERSRRNGAPAPFAPPVVSNGSVADSAETRPPTPAMNNVSPATPDPDPVIDRDPAELVRSAARLAFSAGKTERNLAQAYKLIYDAAKAHPELAVRRADWRTLWTDPHFEPALVDAQEAGRDGWPLTQLVVAMQTARDIGAILAQSQTYPLSNLRSRQAKDDYHLLEQWRDQFEDAETDALLPYQVGRGAWWHAITLCRTRMTLPPTPELTRAERPYNKARRLYSDAMWQMMLGQGPHEQPATAFRLNAQSLLDEVQNLQEAPWADAARQLQQALQHESLIVTAFYLYQLQTPDAATPNEQARLHQLQVHTIDAAWEHLFAMLEKHKPVERAGLQMAQSQLVNAAFDVTRMAGEQGLRLSTLYNLLSLLIHDPDGPVINGFYAYEVRVPRQLGESDFRRLSQMRRTYIERAWHTVLDQARQRRPVFLPAGARSISRIQPDSTTPEGRRLQATRALLAHVTSAEDNWIEYAALIYTWYPPLLLTNADHERLDELKAHCVEQAWRYTLDAIRGREQPALTTGHIQQLKGRLAELELLGQDGTTMRLRAIADLFKLLLKLKAPESGLVVRAQSAQAALTNLSPSLSADDARALREATLRPIEALWEWSVRVARNPFAAHASQVHKELALMPSAKFSLGQDGSLWEAIHHLLTSAARRLEEPGQPKWDKAADEMFEAYRTINTVRNADDAFRSRYQQLHELSYTYLLAWKDALPVRPTFWQRRRVHAEKRSIQNYWLLRKEYGAK